MKYIFVDESWEDYLYWQKNDRKILGPEPLKYKYKGFWSRRINEAHRLIYQVADEEILIAKCRFQYD